VASGTLANRCVTSVSLTLPGSFCSVGVRMGAGDVDRASTCFDERKLMHHFMCEQNKGFTWDDSEHGRFREDFFPPVMMPVVEHKL
jgi:hypothetical protein